MPGALNEAQAREAVLAALLEVAPEVKADQIDPQLPLAEQLDIDSMDLLNMLIGIHRRTGIEIPERDAAQLSTLNGAVLYVVQAARETRPSTGA